MADALSTDALSTDALVVIKLCIVLAVAVALSVLYVYIQGLPKSYSSKAPAGYKPPARTAKFGFMELT